MNPSTPPIDDVVTAVPHRRPNWWRKLFQPRFSLTIWAVQFWRERLTRAGRYAMIGAVTTAIAATLPEQMVGSFAFSFFASLGLLAITISLIRRPRVDAVRHVAQRVMQGTTTELLVTITNRSRKPALDVGGYEFRVPLALPMTPEAQYIDRLEPGQSHTFRYTLSARRRGHYVLHGPAALSTFPFGLTNAVRFSPQLQHVVVYPAFHPIQKIAIDPANTYQPGGVALASRIGDTMEFIGNRPFRPGDRVRDLHPRSWARVGEPVVRQFEEEFIVRVAMVVDTFVPAAFGVRRRGNGRRLPRLVLGADGQLLEANLSLAAAVAEYLARQEYVVDLFAAGPQLYYFQAGRSLGYLDNILDILASIECCRSDPFEVIGPSFTQQLRQTSTVVALLAGWDKRRARFVDLIRDAGVPVRLIVTTDNPDEAAAAALAGAIHLNTDDVERGVEVL